MRSFPFAFFFLIRYRSNFFLLRFLFQSSSFSFISGYFKLIFRSSFFFLRSFFHLIIPSFLLLRWLEWIWCVCMCVSRFILTWFGSHIFDISNRVYTHCANKIRSRTGFMKRHSRLAASASFHFSRSLCVFHMGTMSKQQQQGMNYTHTITITIK